MTAVKSAGTESAAGETATMQTAAMQTSATQTAPMQAAALETTATKTRTASERVGRKRGTDETKNDCKDEHHLTQHDQLPCDVAALQAPRVSRPPDQTPECEFPVARSITSKWNPQPDH